MLRGRRRSARPTGSAGSTISSGWCPPRIGSRFCAGLGDLHPWELTERPYSDAKRALETTIRCDGEEEFMARAIGHQEMYFGTRRQRCLNPRRTLDLRDGALRASAAPGCEGPKRRTPAPWKGDGRLFWR